MTWHISATCAAGTNGAADVLRSKQAGELVQCERPKTLADGLRGRMGDLTWPIVRDFVDDVITVSEEEIIDAMQLCFERMKVWSYLRHLALNKMACCFCAGRFDSTSMCGLKLTSVSDTTPAGSQKLQDFAQSTFKACAPPNVLHPHSAAHRDADKLTSVMCCAACSRAQRGCWTGSSTDRDLSESRQISAQTHRHYTMRRQCGPGCHGALEAASRSCSEFVARRVGNASLQSKEFARNLAFERSGSLCQHRAISCTHGGSHVVSAPPQP